MEKTIRSLTVLYKTNIKDNEVHLFRGAVIKAMSDRANVLYHNHTGEKTLRFSYPLIQYKCLNGKAAITCVEEGTDIIGQFFTETTEPLMIGHRQTKLEVEKVIPEKTTIQVSSLQESYELHQWLPLNSKNYERYLHTESLVEKIQILEHVLAGNILSFLKGVNIHLEEHFDVHITDITKQNIIIYKNVKLMAFDIKFKANITLPSYIGIGKNASIGNGILIKR